MSDERSAGTERLRRAGVGVVAGGMFLAVLSVLVPFQAATGLLLALAIGGGLVAYRRNRSPQLYVGIGAVGVLGLLETLPGVGVGLTALELAVVAVVLGVVDIVAGTVLGRFRPGTE